MKRSIIGGSLDWSHFCNAHHWSWTLREVERYTAWRIHTSVSLSRLKTLGVAVGAVNFESWKSHVTVISPNWSRGFFEPNLSQGEHKPQCSVQVFRQCSVLKTVLHTLPRPPSHCYKAILGTPVAIFHHISKSTIFYLRARMLSRNPPSWIIPNLNLSSLCWEFIYFGASSSYRSLHLRGRWRRNNFRSSVPCSSPGWSPTHRSRRWR